MKKFIFGLTILLFFIFCLWPYDKFKGFIHYDLRNNRVDYFNYSEDGIKYDYAIADITPEKSEVRVTGLLYKVAKNDYILLDKIESNDAVKTLNYGNKLYLTSCSTCHYEYTLNAEKIIKKELKFDYSKIGKKFRIYYPIKIEDNYIYYETERYDSDVSEEYWGRRYILKCSLQTGECFDATTEENQ